MEGETALVEEALSMVVSTTLYKLSRVRPAANAGLFAYRFLAYVPFSAIAMTITAAAKIELYTYLACEAHRPVVNPDRDATLFLGHDNPAYNLTLDRTCDSFWFAGGRLTVSPGPDWQRVCHADPVVSAAVAELNIIMTTAMGILSCMTTAWWGAVCTTAIQGGCDVPNYAIAIRPSWQD